MGKRKPSPRSINCSHFQVEIIEVLICLVRDEIVELEVEMATALTSGEGGHGGVLQSSRLPRRYDERAA